MFITCLESNFTFLTKKDDQYNSRLSCFKYSNTHQKNQYEVINLVRMETIQRPKIVQIAMIFFFEMTFLLQIYLCNFEIISPKNTANYTEKKKNKGKKQTLWLSLKWHLFKIKGIARIPLLSQSPLFCQRSGTTYHHLLQSRNMFVCLLFPIFYLIPK